MGSSRRRFLTCVVPAIVVIAVLGVGGVWAFRWLNDTFGDLREAARSLPAELAAAKREGLPLEPADLRRKPPVPDSRNAAPYLREMARECEATRARSSAETGDVGAAMRRPGRSAADRQAARDLLERESRMIELAEKVAAKPDCDMEKPYEQGPDLMFPEFAAARQAARLLAIRAILSSDSGRLQSAFRDIGTGLRLARQVGREPCLIAMLVRVAIEAIMGAALEQVALDHIGEPRVIRLAERALAAQGPLASIEYATRSEMILGRTCVDLVRKEGSFGRLTGTTPSPDIRRRMASERLRRPLCDAMESRIVAHWRKVFHVLRSSRNDPARRHAALSQIAAHLESEGRKPSHILLNIVVPVYTQADDKVLHMQAQRHLRATLLRIVSYRNRTGAFPRDLAQLGGNVALDPFSGKPLVYRRSERGFVLYSIGMDRKDDGGMAVKPGPDKPVPDIVVQYPRVGPR